MKTTITIAFLFAAAICAPAADKDPDTAKTPAALTIPKDAVLNPDSGTYSYTDKQGKKWIYARTPFGITRAPYTDQPAGGAAAKPDPNGIRAIDKGDTVRFERPTPFGPMGWEKKKSELTDEERQIIARQKDAQDAKNQANGKTR
jgi:hypothetical protein